MQQAGGKTLRVLIAYEPEIFFLAVCWILPTAAGGNYPCQRIILALPG